MSHEQKSARLIRVLLAETLVIKRRNHRLSGTCGGNNKVSVIATNLAFRFHITREEMDAVALQSHRRVAAGQDGVPAPANLQVPPYHFVSDTLIQIGVGPQGAA